MDLYTLKQIHGFWVGKMEEKQGPQGSQKLSFLKSLKIKNTPLLPGILTPATVRNGFLNKF